MPSTESEARRVSPSYALCCFPVKKDHWWWKTRETPVDSAFAPVEKAGKLGNFFVEIFNIVENRHANAHKSALFASAFSTRKRGG